MLILAVCVKTITLSHDVKLIDTNCGQTCFESGLKAQRCQNDLTDSSKLVLNTGSFLHIVRSHQITLYSRLIIEQHYNHDNWFDKHYIMYLGLIISSVTKLAIHRLLIVNPCQQATIKGALDTR